MINDNFSAFVVKVKEGSGFRADGVEIEEAAYFAWGPILAAWKARTARQPPCARAAGSLCLAPQAASKWTAPAELLPPRIRANEARHSVSTNLLKWYADLGATSAGLMRRPSDTATPLRPHLCSAARAG